MKGGNKAFRGKTKKKRLGRIERIGWKKRGRRDRLKEDENKQTKEGERKGLTEGET